MKLSLKLVILCFPVFFLSGCNQNPEINTGKEPPVVSYRRSASTRNTDTIPPGVYRERRNNATPAELEEMRIQRSKERAERVEWIKSSVKKYSPASWDLLMQYDRLPESVEVTTTTDGIAYTRKAAGTFDYLRGRSRIDLLVSMETNVHEIAHAYFDQAVFRYLTEKNLKMNIDDAQGYIYLSPSESLFVSFPRNSMFPSGEIKAEIPGNLKTYRFETYISGTTSTQSDGIIGLLNELSAYFLGSSYCFDMLEPYKEAAGSDATGLFEWVTHTQSTMSAFYEFDFFIKEYLLYMKKNYMTDYEKLRTDPLFPEAYRTLYRMYDDLISRYLDRIEKEMQLLNSSGKAKARIDKGWLWVTSGNSHVSSGAPVFSEDREILMPVLESRRYREVEKEFPVK